MSDDLDDPRAEAAGDVLVVADVVDANPDDTLRTDGGDLQVVVNQPATLQHRPPVIPAQLFF